MNDRPHFIDPSDPTLWAERKERVTSAGTVLQSFVDHSEVLRQEETM